MHRTIYITQATLKAPDTIDMDAHLHGSFYRTPTRLGEVLAEASRPPCLNHCPWPEWYMSLLGPTR